LATTVSRMVSRERSGWPTAKEGSTLHAST
jgi:hypothetical protein